MNSVVTMHRPCRMLPVRETWGSNEPEKRAFPGPSQQVAFRVSPGQSRHRRRRGGPKAAASFPCAPGGSQDLRYIWLCGRVSHTPPIVLCRKCSFINIPFGGAPLLLDLGEDAVRLVVYAMRASRKLAVAFDLLLPAHITRLDNRGDLSVCSRTIAGWKVARGAKAAGARRCHAPSRFFSSWPRSHRQGEWRDRGTSARRARVVVATRARHPASMRRRSGEVGSAGLGGPSRAFGSPCGP